MSTEYKNEQGDTEEVLAVVTLRYPVQIKNSAPITELVCRRRLKAGDFRGLNSAEVRFDDMLKLIGRLFTIPDHVVNALDATDMMEASKVVNSFLTSGPLTGEIA